MTKVFRAYKGYPYCSGLSDEDLEAVPEYYQGTADSCDATDLEKKKIMFSMILHSALTLLNRKGEE